MEFVTPQFILLAILAGSLVLFLTESWPVELVAMLVLVVLLVTNLVDPSKALSGFSNPATITVAAMFVLSAGLERTGVVRWLAQKISSFLGNNRAMLVGTLGSVTGALSAFINNTAMVAVMLPVVMNLCKTRGISPTRVLLPLSFAAQLGGVCTLIGTSTNLLVAAVALQAGQTPFSLFEISKLGLISLGVGLVYLLFASRFLLGDRVQPDNAAADYRLNDYLIELKVLAGSPLIGKTSENANWGGDIQARILDIIRDGHMVWAPHASAIQKDDVLLIRGDVGQLLENLGRLKLEDWAQGKLSDAHLKSDDITLVEVMIPAGSHLIGRTLSQLDFYWRYHAAVLGLKRRGEVVRARIAHIRFEEGDTLLLQGHREDLAHLHEERDFLPLKDLAHLKLRTGRALAALAVMAGVVAAAAANIVSIVTAALVGCVVMVFFKCLSVQEATKAIDMKVVLLLGGLIPLGIAMETSGTATQLTGLLNSLYSHLDGQWAAFVALGLIYLATSVLTALMSNNATAVLMAPLAIGIAGSLGVDARPFLVAVMFAASTCFATPVGYQTNTMVYAPGGYKYADFIRVGLPLNIILFVVSVTLIPLFWPF